MKRQLLNFCLLFISVSLHSQNLGTISGKVFNNETGLFLEGATIQVENSEFFAITNSEGFFEINDVPTSSYNCLLYTSPSPRDRTRSRMPSSA